MARLFGAVLGWLVGSLLRVRRRHVVDAMRRAGIAEPERTALAMYRALGVGLFELVGLLVVPWRRASARVRMLDGALTELGAGGRGAVVAVAHTGNWDLCACAAAERHPLHVVTKRLSVGAADWLWQRVRRVRGVRLVEAGQVRYQGARALARGELLAMMIDQAPERERGVVLEPFLGELARVDLAPALLALRARVPLVAVFPRRTRDGHVLEVSRVIEPPERPTRAWAEHAMRQLTRDLDAFVRRHPEQWLWMHRRWKGATAMRLAKDSGNRAFWHDPARLHRRNAGDQIEVIVVVQNGRRVVLRERADDEVGDLSGAV
jgi:Kdo2-lipid IVA lauroyltransferase/acyltransferase